MSIKALNAKNQFTGNIRPLDRGPLFSEVEVETPGGNVKSMITSSSLKYLRLQIGQQILAAVKATEATIATL